MNRVILIGNLAADPELRKTQNDVSVCTFRLAVQRRFPNQQGVREADFFSCVAWRQTAELCAKFLTKGRKAGISGSIQNRSYDAQDGTKKYVTEVLVDEVEFLTPRDRDADSAYPEPPPEPANRAPRATQTAMDMTGGFTEVDDDELPF